jgi:hypothetical protein
MVPGYVQGGTRPPPECPEGPLGEDLYSSNLWIVGGVGETKGDSGTRIEVL